MRVYPLSEMKRGWFVGDFTPSALRTETVEVALLRFSAGSPAEPHFHKRATEINLLLHGVMRVNGLEIRENTIFVLEPGEVSDAEFLTDCDLVVVKTPSVPGDKYLAPCVREKEDVNAR